MASSSDDTDDEKLLIEYNNATEEKPLVPKKEKLVETKLERRRRLGRERRRRWWAKKNEQELLNAKRVDSERRRKRYALLKQTGIVRAACFHCTGNDSITVDINDITFAANGHEQFYTLAECYKLITGIKIEKGQPAGTKICQMCQNQMIGAYNFKRQYQQQQLQVKVKRENSESDQDDTPNFTTVLVSEFGQEPKPMIRANLPELGPPIMPETDQAHNQCSICTMEFNSRRRYQRHMKNHAEKYVCEHCGFQTSYKPQIRDHLMIHSRGYVCCVCNEKFPNRILRKQHQQLKHVVSNVGATELAAEDLGIKIQCSYCGLFVHKISMRSHMQSHSSTVECSQCNKSFKSRKNLVSHIWSVHSETPPEGFVKCNFCPQIYLKQIYLDRHLEKVHNQPMSQGPIQQLPQKQPIVPEITVPDNEDTIKCNLCPKVFTKHMYLERHMAKVHTHELPFKCHTCGNSYDKESTLFTHMSTHTDGQHECQICHARFAYSTGLFHHIKKIHTETCSICPVTKCGEVMTNANLLDHHSNIHSTTVAVECSVCDVMYEDFFALYDHYEKTHRVAKSYYQKSRHDNCKCLHCGRNFNILNNLKNHIISIRLERKHADRDCKYCYQPARKRK